MLIKQIQWRLEYIKQCDVYEARIEIEKLIEIVSNTQQCQQLLEIQAKLDELVQRPIKEYKTDWKWICIAWAITLIVCLALAM